MTGAIPRFAWLRACALPLLVGGPAAYAQNEGAFDRTPQDCVVVSSIDETEALDDQNIIFRMRGNRVYRNHLPRRCPGLERENRFMYETRGGRLCSIDTITVLEQFGVSLQRGFTCRLGEFVPLSPDEIEDLDFSGDGRSSQGVIRAEPVELQPKPAEESEEAAEGETEVDSNEAAEEEREPGAPSRRSSRQTER
jgi:hypothetical protein